MVNSSTKKKQRGQKVPNTGVNLPSDTKERLIQAAKCLFAEKGFDGTTVKDISDRAGVNISLISYHFEGKEGLYRSCLEQFGKMRLAILKRILQIPQSSEEFQIRIRLFMEEILNIHLEEPELSLIVQRECEMSITVAEDIFRSTFLKFREILVQFLRAAQKRGIIQKELDVEITAGFLFGGLLQAAQKDKMNKAFYGKTIRDQTYREQLLSNYLLLCLRGCLKNSQ